MALPTVPYSIETGKPRPVQFPLVHAKETIPQSLIAETLEVASYAMRSSHGPLRFLAGRVAGDWRTIESQLNLLDRRGSSSAPEPESDERHSPAWPRWLDFLNDMPPIGWALWTLLCGTVGYGIDWFSHH
jgi:hypothetical protein